MKNEICDYLIIINQEPKNITNTYTYKYYNNNIQLIISDKCGIIKFSRKKEKIEKFQEGKYFNGALNRFLFAYLLNYNEIIEINNCKVRIDNQLYENIEFNYIPTFKTIAYERIPKSLCKPSIVNILLQKFGDSDRRFASLNNYILAKNMESPIENFIHLWMAFNGLYGFLSNLIKKEVNWTKNLSEQKELEWWGIFNDLNTDFCFIENINHDEISKEIKKLICSKDNINQIKLKSFDTNKLNILLTKKLFEKYTNELNTKKTKELNDENSKYEKELRECNSKYEENLARISPDKIDKIEKLNNSQQTRIQKINNKHVSTINEINQKYLLPEEYVNQISSSFGFILLKTTYYARCNLIHGSRKIQLFVKTQEDYNKYIKFINNLLIQYLETQYEVFFDDEYLENLINQHKDKVS